MKKSLVIYTCAIAVSLAAPPTPVPSATSKIKHWAFQPVTRSQIPEVSDPSWIKTPVDAFILAKLDAAGLQPAAPADPRTLLRRLSYHLTGLPPTFEETQSTKDPQTAIDSLLASPHFGERWARQWLDIARYSDTKGYAYSPEEFTFVHAWLYRDWVVGALNDDLPFDQFLIRQLAADRLLERNECEQSDLAAMGFLTLGRRFIGVEQDIIDDRIDTVTRGMLGLTVSCSRCHDHKYDPIPTADYYALYAIFDSSHDTMVALKESDDSVLKELREQMAAEFEKHATNVEKRHLERVGEYLAATLDMSIVPPPDFAELFTKDDLNPAQIRRWNEYLSLSEKENHPIFAPWVALTKIPLAEFFDKATATLQSLRDIDPVITKALTSPPLRDKQDLTTRYAKIFKEKTQHPAIARIISGPGSPIAIPRDRHLHDIEWLFADDERNSLKKKLAEIERRIYQLGNDAPHTVAMADQAVPKNTRVLLRGSYATPGEEVTRRALDILGGAKFT
ncbi:DUF1549 domain-containing protein, partial [Akkermansiaceae bacterium]|nr:DUF1549 domain-containing protein [Akkermansiaceae bacterium]